MLNQTFIRAFFIGMMTIITISAKAQVTIGSEKAPESFSILELDSSEGGLRLNQVNASQKAQIQSKFNSSNKELSKGLTIYDTDTQTIQYWDGDNWVPVIGTLSAGEAGQYLKSNGENSYPEWVTLKIPEIKKGDYYLHSTQVVQDMVGVLIGNKADDLALYTENELLNSSWSVIEDLKLTVTIPSVPNKPADKVATRMSVQFQAGAQIGTGVITNDLPVNTPGGTKTLRQTTIPAISFVIGIFVGNDLDGYRLKLARVDRIDANGGGQSFSVYTVMGTVEDLPPGEQTVKVAVKRRQSINMDFTEKPPTRTKNFALGRQIPNATNYNPFMAQSSLKVDVYVLDTEE